MTVWIKNCPERADDLKAFEGTGILIDLEEAIIVEEGSKSVIEHKRYMLEENNSNESETALGLLQYDDDGKPVCIVSICDMQQDYWLTTLVTFKWWTTVPKFKDATTGG